MPEPRRRYAIRNELYMSEPTDQRCIDCGALLDRPPRIHSPKCQLAQLLTKEK